MWINGKYYYQCEHCGWGWQEAGISYNQNGRYFNKEGRCRDCHGYGYLGFEDIPEDKRAIKSFETNKRHNEKLGRDFTIQGD